MKWFHLDLLPTEIGAPLFRLFPYIPQPMPCWGIPLKSQWKFMTTSEEDWLKRRHSPWEGGAKDTLGSRLVIAVNILAFWSKARKQIKIRKQRGARDWHESGCGRVTSNPYVRCMPTTPPFTRSVSVKKKKKRLVKCKCLWLERREKRALEWGCNYGWNEWVEWFGCTAKYLNV